ncbi:MAG: peptidoglycan DD-metalloendopeptidase family protein [Pseudomonadota bacterium]
MRLIQSRVELKVLWQKAIAPREFFFRSNDQVRYFQLTSRLQTCLFAAAGTAGLLLISSAVAAGYITFSALEIQDDLERQKLAYVDQKFGLNTSGLIEGSPTFTPAKAGDVDWNFKEQLSQAKALALQLATTAKDLDRSEEKNQLLAGQLAERETVLQSLHQEQAKLQNDLGQSESQILALEQLLSEARSKNTLLRQEIAENQELMSSLGQETKTADMQRHVAENQVTALEEQMAAVSDANQIFLRRVWDHTERSLDSLEKTIVMTGIDLDALLGEDDKISLVPRGGPFIAADPYETLDHWLGTDKSVALLDARFDRWAHLREVMAALPLAPPLEQFRITSSFGTRVDPVNGRQARHDGMDFAAPFKSSIYATAAGTVTFAGWRGHYGKIVEIDHGHGLKTVYGHLNSILVKTGDYVESHQKIGLLGSSGRSTGPHIHYEVRFKGQPLDPAKFLTAGKYVFKS